MKLEALDHPKTLNFASELGVKLPTAIGYLELLWAFVARKTPRGDVGKWPDGVIATACMWTGKPAKFVQSLVTTGFIDPDDEHRLIVHDWSQHCPNWVRAKLKKDSVEFVLKPTLKSGSYVPSNDPSSVASSRADLNQAKPSQGKTSRAELPPAPVDLDLDSWTRWIEYRAQIGKPIKPASIHAAQQELAEFGKDQAAVVQQSIASGWQGLFPLKAKPVTNGALDPNAVQVYERLIETDGAERDSRAQKALDRIGGWPRIAERTTKQAEKIKAEFCHAYVEAA